MDGDQNRVVEVGYQLADIVFLAGAVSIVKTSRSLISMRPRP
jgi:hypothetical protein